MLKILLGGMLVVLGGSAVCGQSFEVASARVATAGNRQCSGGPGTPDPERLNCTNVQLKVLICMAYDVQFYQVFGPGWTDTDGFDVVAKIPAGTSKAQYQRMLQKLLAERFQLVIHREDKLTSTYSLVVAKGGSKLAQSAGGTPSGSFTAVGNHVRYAAMNQPVSTVAGFLSTKVGVEAPVTDATGLGGVYNFVLEFEPGLAGDGDSVYSALETQLGLKLESKKAPMDTLTIERVERKPSEN